MEKEKIIGEQGELDKPFDYGKVDAKTELKAAFFGDEDQMIIEYLKRVPNPRGVILANLILYFCYRYGFMGERRLKKRLSHLIKMNLICTTKESGLTFYKAV
jgi:hypothetical protein